MCSCLDPPPLVAAGIDVAALTGWAIVEANVHGQKLLAHGTAKIRRGADVERLVDELAGAGPQVIALERPFVKPASRGGNPHSGLELAELLGRFRQAFEMLGAATLTVLASTWQPAILGVDRWANRETRKAAAVAWARRELGAELSEDEADAAAIAAWAIRQRSGRPERPET